MARRPVYSCVTCNTQVEVQSTRCTDCRKRRRSYKGARTARSLRAPFHLYQEAATAAQASGVDLNQWIVDAIDERLSRV